MIRIIWGMALIIVGILVFIKTLNNSSLEKIPTNINLSKFVLFFLSISLIFGGIKKLLDHYKSKQ